nr:MAG TPA: hypothetical protein [Crassvirales sp.]
MILQSLSCCLQQHSHWILFCTSTLFLWSTLFCTLRCTLWRHCSTFLKLFNKLIFHN